MMMIALGTQVLAAKRPPTARRIEHTDSRPSEGESWTAKRVLTLNAWAAELLSSRRDEDDFQQLANAYFKKIGVTDAEPLSQYTLGLRPGSECFSDGSKSLYSNNNRDLIKQQLESAAHFIFEFHKTMHGKMRGPFALREVEICPLSTTQKSLHFVGGKLIIGIPAGWIASYVPYTSDALLRAWNAGEHLSVPGNSGLSPAKLQQIWLVFNPIGHVRTALRDKFHEQGDALTHLLRRLRSRLSVSMWQSPGEVMAAAREQLDHSFFQNNATSALLLSALPTNIAEKVQQLPPDKLALLLDNWVCVARQRRLADDLSHAALGALETTMRSETNDITVNINAGLVAVGNYHRIGVTLAGGDFGQRKFIEVPEQATRQTRVNANVSANLVAVFTIDDISVDVALGWVATATQKSLATASFEEAWLTMLAGQKASCESSIFQ